MDMDKVTGTKHAELLLVVLKDDKTISICVVSTFKYYILWVRGSRRGFKGLKQIGRAEAHLAPPLHLPLHA